VDDEHRKMESGGTHDHLVVESNLDAVPRRNGHVSSAFSMTPGANGGPVKEDHGSTGHVQNYEVLEISQSCELSGSVVYHEVKLNVKEDGAAGRKRDYYNVPSSSQATLQDYSLPSDCRTEGRAQDYAVPVNPSSLNSREYASVGDVLKDHGYDLPEGPKHPQDYSLPSVIQRDPANSMPGDLTDPEDYSVPDPEDYSTPVAFGGRSAGKSQPYEVPAEVRRPSEEVS